MLRSRLESWCRLTWGRLSLALVSTIVGIGGARGGEPERIDLPTLHATDGRSVTLKAPDRGATAVVFLSTECPISNAYSPTLNKLAAAFPAGRVRTVGVCVDPDLSDADVAAHARDFGLKFPVVRDRLGALAARLGATVTPEAFVIDDAGRVRYHGRIDDQFAGRQKANANPVTSELADAVDAVLAGRPVAAAHVPAVGCPLPEAPAAAAAPTYAGQVSRILRNNCQECHRKGQVGPFTLDTYEQARKRAGDLAAVAGDRSMPPWKPVPGFGPKFRHDRSLSEADVATLASWAAAGAPEGNPADLPAPRVWSDDWALGTPDLVIDPAAEFAVAAAGDDVYRCFVVPTKLPKDMYVQAIEYRPGNRRVVHHMLAFVDVSGKARERDAAEPGPGYTCFSGPGVEVQGDLGGWAPGNEPRRLPEGVGRSLPKGADVIVQVHYHSDGKPETDRSKVGLHFARKPVQQVLHWAAAADDQLRIEPGESNHTSRAEWKVPVDLIAHNVTPHMHLLGRDMTLRVKYPDGRSADIIRIADWDFAWQNTYEFETPIDLPKGSVVTLEAHFDNTEANPRNKNRPLKVVTWGEATTDEMSIGFLGVTKKGQDLTRPGEKDDLRDIFQKQSEGVRRQREASARSRAAEPRKATAAKAGD